MENIDNRRNVESVHAPKDVQHYPGIELRGETFKTVYERR
jgi:hypothetical protein